MMSFTCVKRHLIPNYYLNKLKISLNNAHQLKHKESEKIFNAYYFFA